MPAPTETEVLEQATWLENLGEEKEMRDRTERFHSLAFMELEQDLPDHVSRGHTREIPLADLLDMAYSVQSERHSYQTSVILTALDDTPQTTVDRIEKAIAVRVGQHLRKWNVQDEAGFHQLLSYAGIILWHCDAPGAPIPTYIETPDPGTFFAPVKGAGRPAMYARRFSMMLRDVERTFENGMRDGQKPFMKSDGGWDRIKVSDDRPRDAMGLSGPKGLARDVELIEMDDGEYVTLLALNRTGTGAVPANGMILWQDKNRAGPDDAGNPAAAALIVPGILTPHRKPKHRLLPMFIKGLQCVHAMDYLIALLATKAENATGDVLVEQSPEQMQAAAALGRTGATVAQLEQGNPSIIELAGKPLVWERLPEPYLIKLFDFWSLKYESWANSLREITDPTLLAQINTNVYLPHAAARRKLMGPMLDYTDSAMKELVRMDMHALQFYGSKTVTYIATGTERYGAGSREMNRGEKAEITWADVKDFDKRFQLTISTSSMTEEEQRQRLVDHKNKVLMGYATDRQGISVAGYSDEEAQVEALAIDEVRKEATALVRPMLPGTIQEAIMLMGGIGLSLAPPEVQGQEPGNLNTPGSVTYNAPTVPGGAGSSAPAVA